MPRRVGRRLAPAYALGVHARVGAARAVDRVRSRPAVEVVVLRATDDRVITVLEDVAAVVGEASGDVVAVAGHQVVVAVRPVHEVRTPASNEQITVTAAQDQVVAATSEAEV